MRIGRCERLDPTYTGTVRILVVEDDPDTRLELRLLLEEEGYTVLEARDGKTAIAVASEQLPDLVLLDLLLPDIPEFQLLEALRQLPGAQTVPVVALSGFAERLNEAQRSSLAFSAYLAKPVSGARLCEVVRTQLRPRLVP
jgi:CheY-like chemotaxis protein